LYRYVQQLAFSYYPQQQARVHICTSSSYLPCHTLLLTYYMGRHAALLGDLRLREMAAWLQPPSIKAAAIFSIALALAAHCIRILLGAFRLYGS
jgi:hypothetical protein